MVEKVAMDDVLERFKGTQVTFSNYSDRFFIDFDNNQIVIVGTYTSSSVCLSMFYKNSRLGSSSGPTLDAAVDGLKESLKENIAKINTMLSVLEPSTGDAP